TSVWASVISERSMVGLSRKTANSFPSLQSLEYRRAMARPYVNSHWAGTGLPAWPAFRCATTSLLVGSRSLWRISIQATRKPSMPSMSVKEGHFRLESGRCSTFFLREAACNELWNQAQPGDRALNSGITSTRSVEQNGACIQQVIQQCALSRTNA